MPDPTLITGKTGSSDDKISSFISEIVPGYVKDNHQGFVSFMEAYYEWMEFAENPAGVSMTFMDTLDVDRTLDSFVQYFRKTYIADFPQIFAINSSGESLDKTTLIKNISDFYGSKGTEKAIKLLLRVLHDSDADFYYPGQDILRVSDGKWVENKSIKVTSDNGMSNFEMSGSRVYQYDKFGIGKQTAYADVESVIQYNVNQYVVTELFLKNILGTFTKGSQIKGTMDDGTELTETIYSIPSVINIDVAGSGYKNGDNVEIDTLSAEYLSGKGAKAKISQVGTNGNIIKIDIKDFGVNYESSGENIPLTFKSASGDGYATGNASLSALCEYPGYWTNNDGKLSSNKFTRDNHYYQEHSYVLKSEVALDTYRKQAKKLVHPAGTKMFGNISLFNSATITSPYFTKLDGNETPVIGRYTPYTLNSIDNLRGTTATGSEVDLYPTGFKPTATGTGHCLGTTGGRIEILGTGNGSFTLGSFRTSESMSGASSGFTADIFGWSRKSATGGVLFLKANDGASLGFTIGEEIVATGGITGTIVNIQVGNGTVLDTLGITHLGLFEGPSGGASSFGYTYWGINESFQKRFPTDFPREIFVNTFTQITGGPEGQVAGYTVGYDYTIGNVVQQTIGDGVSAQGIVKDWIPGTSGATMNTLKVYVTSDESFGTGDVVEIDNHTGNNSVIYTFVTGGVGLVGTDNAGETISQPVKMLGLETVVRLPASWQYHSGDTETGVVGGYT
ncbi:MAG: hypothetical protein H8D80_01830 [Proteobacteria bacterium]|nr:hypothetical protein [Pseudomonadota bacterium]